MRGLYGCWRGFGRVVSVWVFGIGVGIGIGIASLVGVCLGGEIWLRMWVCGFDLRLEILCGYVV